MISFDELLARADTQLLAKIAGEDTIRLLSVLGKDHARPTALKRLVLALKSPQDLLSDNQTRAILLDLMRPAELTEIAARLSCSEARVVSERLPRQDLRELCHLLGHPFLDDEPVVAPFSTEVMASSTLFPHQRAALSNLRARLGGPGGGRALLHMPTGSGKTRTAMHFVAERLREDEPGCALWFASTTELCEQAVDEFMSCWGSIGNRPIRAVRAWAGRTPDAELLDDSFVVASVATAREKWVREAKWVAGLGDRLSLLVYDEAHQALAPWSLALIEGLLARREDSRLLGLSATPGRTWNDPAEDAKLASLFLRNKVSLQVPGFANPIDFLIREQYLARPTFSSARWRSSEPPERERRAIREAFEIPESVLEQLAADEIRNLRIIQEVERMVSSCERILVFATTVRHAKLLAAVLTARGVPARCVAGDMPREQRSAAVNWYRVAAPEPRVLTNFGVLTTGFDAPRTRGAVIARPTKSLVLYSQMVGRALRGHKAGGNDDAMIVTINDFDLPGFRNPQETFYNWEDVW